MENAKLVNVFLPDYVPIFYLGESISSQTESALVQEGALVFRRGGVEDYRATMWRFEAVSIKGLERVLFRDCDSRVTERESEMVRAWEASGRTAHIIRDHPWHSAAILAGMFGVSNLRGGLAMFETSLEGFLSMPPASFYGVDQLFLVKEVYPRIRRDALVHDSFFSYEFRKIVPKASADGSFVGERIYCDGTHSLALRTARIRHQRNWVRRISLKLHPFSILNFLKGRGLIPSNLWPASVQLCKQP